MSSDVVKWISCELSKLLGTDADEDVARYLLSIDTAAELEDYLGEILDVTVTANKNFVQQLLERWQQRDKTVHEPAANCLQKREKPLPSAENRSSKTKFVPLFSPEGHDRTVAVIPGRQQCECQASKHNLVNNCRNCGRVVCEQEGSGPCFFCHSLVCSKAEQEILDRGSKKSERLHDYLMKQVPSVKSESANDTIDAGLRKALEHRDRLLEYDKTSAKRTHVIDDEADYFATDSNQWLTSKQREALRSKHTEVQSKRHASRRERARQVTVDFTGRRVIEEDRGNVDSVTGDDTGSEQPQFNPDDFNVDLVNPDIRLPAAPQFVQTRSFSSAVSNSHGDSNSNGVTSTLRTLRLQDSELQLMSDEGLALSMHQPWASLLVAGIKCDESRSWYSAHRGILWIASTAKPPQPSEIAAVEDFYRKYYSDTSLMFPSSYPSGCLLGCVCVADCLSQADYHDQYPDGESDSAFVFVCRHPRQLVVKFPIRGKHKIYKLDRHVHQAAKKCLSPA